MKNNYIKKYGGFTLIELLVVIAIIGILSSIVLASLNTARSKGGNAAVKSNLQGIRSQAQIVYDNNNGSYLTPSDVCADTNIVNMLTSASQAGASNTTSFVCNSVDSEWAASSPLKLIEGTNNYWCVDSTGVSRGQANTLGAGVTVCS